MKLYMTALLLVIDVQDKTPM